MYNDVDFEITSLNAKIKEFWGDAVSEIRVTEVTDIPFNMFTMSMIFYGKHQVIMEYERSSVGIRLKIKEEFITLSKLTDEPIYRGLESYVPENLLHNFKVFDKILKNI
jgi:hypothetical protein